MIVNRVGFACKYMALNQNQSKKILKETQQNYSGKTTTITWLESRSKDEVETKLWEIINHNTRAVYNLIEYVGHLAPEQRMVRIGSDQLPGLHTPSYTIFGNNQTL